LIPSGREKVLEKGFPYRDPSICILYIVGGPA